MKTIPNPIVRTVILLLSLLPPRPTTAEPFRDGDRWCAVGDSITHGGRYHDYVYLFYATRFPDRQIEFFNCGISGDSAAGAVRRLNADVLRHKPTVATIMLGMNDVSRTLYEEGQTGPAVQQRREAAIAGHVASMKKLAEQLHAAGVRLVFITPSIFDDTATMERANLPGVNAALGRCAESARQLAHDFNGELVDFHGPMTELNRTHQKDDPRFTIVGADRVHPGDVGHLVMAYLFLKAQGVPQFVADLSVDAAGKREVEFTRNEGALPFPVPTACAAAMKLVPFMDEMNQERLRVTNLPDGTYALSIDGEAIASFPAAELAKGVNLAALTNTPQYRQAMAVAALDGQRFELVRQLRTIAYVEWRMGREIGDPAPFDTAAAVQKFTADPRNAGYNKGRAEEYLRLKPRQQEMEQKVAALVAEVRKAAQPKPHRFEIRPVAK